MKLVVDASVVIPCFVPERFSDVAATWLAVPGTLMAPDFLALECANVLWKKVRLGQIAESVANEALADILSGTIELWSTTRLVGRALALGQELAHSIYDCVYLALAESENADLVTADRSLQEHAARLRKKVRAYWIGDPIPRVH